MSHSVFAIAGLYDHEQEVVLGKERHAPDWGGDELFTSTPRRRRFDRGSHAADRPDRPRLRETTEHPLPARRSGYAVPPVEATEEVEVGEVREVADVSEIAGVSETAESSGVVQDVAAPAGRRTVTVTGHPGAVAARTHRPLDAPRRRPGRTIDDRIGARPDRVAAMAFALGLLLIIIAVASAHG